VHPNFLYAGAVLMRINLSPEASGTDLGLKGCRPAVISKSEKWFFDVA
jgi:hypothetical protein